MKRLLLVLIVLILFRCAQAYASAYWPTSAVIHMGSGTLSAGTATISDTNVTSMSTVLVQDSTNTLLNTGTLSVTSQTAGSGFVVKSNNVLDSSAFKYVIIN